MQRPLLNSLFLNLEQKKLKNEVEYVLIQRAYEAHKKDPLKGEWTELVAMDMESTKINKVSNLSTLKIWVTELIEMCTH